LSTNKAAWALINLAVVRHNLRKIREKIGPSIRIMAVVKADGYGHGMLKISQVILKEKVDALAVANVEEGVELREGGIGASILILGPLSEEGVEPLIHYHLTPTVIDEGMVQKLSGIARSTQKEIGVHINVDTGMGRIGVPYEKAVSFIEKVRGMEGIRIKGIYTHFSSAEEKDKAFSLLQVERFQNILKKLKERKIYPLLKHASNSAAVLDLPDSYLNMIRPGLLIYGYYPSLYVSRSITLKPSMSLRCKIMFIKKVSSGTSIGYGRSYITPRPTSIAILPIGYAHGYPYSLSNKAEVLIGGRRAPVIGKICMDQTLVDVGHIRETKVGDEVVLWGTQGEENLSLEEISLKANTIPYELLTNVGKGVQRIYKDGDY